MKRQCDQHCLFTMPRKEKFYEKPPTKPTYIIADVSSELCVNCGINVWNCVKYQYILALSVITDIIVLTKEVKRRSLKNEKAKTNSGAGHPEHYG